MNSQNGHIGALGRRIAAIEDGVLAGSDRLKEAKRGISFVSTAYASPANHRPYVWGAVAAAAAVLLLTGYFGFSRELTVRVGERTLAAGDWISAKGNETTTLEFSDGSRVVLSASSGVRVRALHRHGAHLHLERGTVEADVRHDTDTNWRLFVGPYTVAVTGTRFSVSWDPETEAFSLDMSEGTVDVSGPMITKSKTVRSDERLIASLGTGRLEFFTRQEGPSPRTKSEDTPEAKSISPDAETPLAHIETVKVRPATTKRPTGVTSDWRSLAERGEYKAAVALARKAGVSSILTTAPAVDLVALGDAARHAGDLSLAGRAYRKVRQRFRTSSHASSAAFALGIMAFDQKRAYPEAAKWFKTIVTEGSGNGSLAREAAGRLIESLDRAGDRPGAEKAAKGYLDRYPSGPHAALARQLTQ